MEEDKNTAVANHIETPSMWSVYVRHPATVFSLGIPNAFLFSSVKLSHFLPTFESPAGTVMETDSFEAASTEQVDFHY